MERVASIRSNTAPASLLTCQLNQFGQTRVSPGDIDLRWAGALLYLNDQIEETGIAAGVLGHPAEGIRWVCKRFAPHGIGLQPGQVILSGSFTRPVAVNPGDRIRADYGPLGDIDINFV